jgi:hypothetical protein
MEETNMGRSVWTMRFLVAALLSQVSAFLPGGDGGEDESLI